MAFDNFSSILQSPAIMKYLANMNAGMQQGFATQGVTPSQAIGMGTAQALQGQVADLNRQQEYQDQLALEERQRQILANRMKDVLGDQGQETDQYGPQALMKKALAMTMSGDPRIMQMGGTLMNVASAMTPKERWQSVPVTFNGKTYEGLAQQNSQTGEIKYAPYMDKIINSGKVEYNAAYGAFVDKDTGIPIIQQPSGQAPSVGQVPSIPSGKGENIFATTQPSTQPTVARMQMPAGLTPKQQFEWKIEEDKRIAKETADIAQEQRRQEFEKGKLPRETQFKKEEEAKNYFDPINQQQIETSRSNTTELLNSLEKQIPAAHTGVGSDIPMVQKFRSEVVGDTAVTNLGATVNRLVTEKIGQMKAAGVLTAGQLNTDRDTALQAGAIFDVNAPKETQMQQLARLKRDLAEADKLIAAKEKQFSSVLSKELPKKEEAPVDNNIVTLPDGRKFNKVTKMWIK